MLAYAVRILPHGVGIAWILLASDLPGRHDFSLDRACDRGFGQAPDIFIRGNLLLAVPAVILFALVDLGHDVILVFVMIVLLSLSGVFPYLGASLLTTEMVSREHLPQVKGPQGITSGAVMLAGSLIGGIIVTMTSVADGFSLRPFPICGTPCGL